MPRWPNYVNLYSISTNLFTLTSLEHYLLNQAKLNIIYIPCVIKRGECGLIYSQYFCYTSLNYVNAKMLQSAPSPPQATLAEYNGAHLRDQTTNHNVSFTHESGHYSQGRD